MKLKDYFKKALKEKWAMGQFNVSNLETLKAVVLAAKAMGSPVIIGTSEGESKFFGLGEAAAMVKFYREKMKLPAYLNLDHGRSLEYIKEAVNAGYDSVHFDGSLLPFDKNAATAKEIVQYAHSKNILVEGEIEEIGGALTIPEQAVNFIKLTKIDRLAINVGTSHGMDEDQIDFSRIKLIRDQLGNFPLVLHGGSGVPEIDIKKAIELGIVKININTELRLAYTGALRNILKQMPQEIKPYKYMPQVIETVQKIVQDKIKILGSDNKI